MENHSLIRSICDCSNEIYCEIGSGSGEHLLELGRRNPKAAFFGFELRFKRAVRTIEKAKRDSVENVYVLRMDARKLDEIFSNIKLSAVYVNFPDPWPKTKQRRHRILNTAFMHTCLDRLKTGGFLSVKTDHEEYFKSFLDLAKSFHNFSILEETFDIYGSEFIANNISTEFEKLFVHQEKPIYYAKLVVVS